MHFDAFSAFCPDALVHFGSGIQVQGGGGGLSGNSHFNENPVVHLNLDLGFVRIDNHPDKKANFFYFTILPRKVLP